MKNCIIPAHTIDTPLNNFIFDQFSCLNRRVVVHNIRRNVTEFVRIIKYIKKIFISYFCLITHFFTDFQTKGNYQFDT